MDKTIFLLGFMASGKSSLGKKVAKRLNIPFIDLDQEIEKEQGQSINAIFAESGEEVFRQLERDCLLRLTENKESKVISLGGGTPCFENNMQHILDSGTSIYLKVDEEILLGRLKQNREKRPLIAHLPDEDLSHWLQKKIKEREAFYAQADCILEDNNPKVEAILELLA